MDFEIKGITCDAEGCDYEDMSIECGSTPEDILRVNDEFLTKLCPKCGARLLTDADHAAVKTMVLLMLEEVTGQEAKVESIMNGSGKIGIGDIK